MRRFSGSIVEASMCDGSLVPRYAWNEARVLWSPSHVCWVAHDVMASWMNFLTMLNSPQVFAASGTWIALVGHMHYPRNRLSWKFTTWAPWVNQSSFKRPIQLHPFNHTNRTILPQCFAVSLNTCLYLQVYVHKHMKLGGWAASSPGNFCKTDTLTGLNLVGPF